MDAFSSTSSLLISVYECSKALEVSGTYKKRVNMLNHEVLVLKMLSNTICISLSFNCIFLAATDDDDF